MTCPRRKVRKTESEEPTLKALKGGLSSNRFGSDTMDDDAVLVTRSPVPNCIVARSIPSARRLKKDGLIASPCPTFGNGVPEPLGTLFELLSESGIHHAGLPGCAGEGNLYLAPVQRFGVLLPNRFVIPPPPPLVPSLL